MIKITKGTAPPILARRGPAKVAEYQNMIGLGKAKNIKFEPKIYAAKSVKNKLIKVHHGKCAYCETNVRVVAYGDVEHFRPKKAYDQNDGVGLCYPGYYWLAYDWSNLLFSCQICNQQYKKNYFPIRNPLARKTVPPKPNISKEVPQLIDPQEDNIDSHLSFTGHTIHPVGGSVRGRTTIELLGLLRSELETHRRNKLECVLALKAIVDIDVAQPGRLPSDLVDNVRKKLAEAISDRGEYSAMIRANL